MDRRTLRPIVEGRLTARPQATHEALRPGLHALGIAATRDALLLVPATYRPNALAPLVLSLHGAGGDASAGLYPLGALADAAGLLLLSPASRASTWDMLVGGYGPDVEMIDRALAMVFARCAVDPTRLGIGGFSDGASYALSLGLANGDLFTHVLAFSPGFAAPSGQVGDPVIFDSHGTEDRVLPIDSCSRRLVPRLRRAGYAVTYVEFDGGHAVPDEIARWGLEWLLTGQAPAETT